MTIEEVVQLLKANQQPTLTRLQELVLRSCWEGKTYTTMAREAHYGAEHIRRVASQLWSLLSDFWGEQISKANFRSTLEPRRLTLSQIQLLEKLNYQAKTTSIEFPTGPVALESKFYICRPPLEELASIEILKPGSLLRIQAPGNFGKSSLIIRLLATAASVGYHIVNIDLQLADNAVFASLDKFLRWLCVIISRKLQIESKLDDYWDTEIGSKLSCTLYFQGYLLEKLKNPFVLVFNQLHIIFEYPEVAKEFLPLLRVWYEQGKQMKIWQKLRLVVSSTEIYVQLKVNQSPFNVGLLLKLPPFDSEQVLSLAQCYGLLWTKEEAKQLMGIVGGHPYLLHLALYHLYQTKVTLKQLLQQATTDSGIYHEHLRELLATLQKEPELSGAFKQVITAPKGVPLETPIAAKLANLWLINPNSSYFYTPSCELYRLYFGSQLIDMKIK